LNPELYKHARNQEVVNLTCHRDSRPRATRVRTSAFFDPDHLLRLRQELHLVELSYPIW
jgi:hypothetical protein